MRAINECYGVHFPDQPELTVERFRREIRELDAWPSNCMVAMGGAGGREPVAVSVGTKRDDEVLVLRVGARPDSLRQGHGSHLLTSLSQKLAVLGPERLIVEIEDRPDLEAFFASLGWQREEPLTDWTLSTAAASEGSAAPAELVTEVRVADLHGAGLLPDLPGVAWQRSRPTLLQSAERLRGVAMVSSERIEAFVLYEPPEEAAGAPARGARPLHALAAGCTDPARAPALLSPLLRGLARRVERPLLLPRMTAAERATLDLEGAGLAAGARYHRWVTRATPL